MAINSKTHFHTEEPERAGSGAADFAAAGFVATVARCSRGGNLLRSTCIVAITRVVLFAADAGASPARNVIFTFPNRRSGTPSRRRSWLRREPSTYVPFVDPTSLK